MSRYLMQNFANFEKEEGYYFILTFRYIHLDIRFATDFYSTFKKNIEYLEKKEYFRRVSMRQLINSPLYFLKISCVSLIAGQDFNFREVAKQVLEKFCVSYDILKYIKRIVSTSLQILKYLDLIKEEIDEFFKKPHNFLEPKMSEPDIIQSWKTCIKVFERNKIKMHYDQGTYKMSKIYIDFRPPYHVVGREFLDNLETQQQVSKVDFRCLQILYLKQKCKYSNHPMDEIEVLRLLWNIIPDPFLTENDFVHMKMMNFECFEWYTKVLEQSKLSPKQPRTLKHLSRVAVRNCLINSSKQSEDLTELHLPEKLMYYLSLNNDSDID